MPEATALIGGSSARLQRSNFHPPSRSLARAEDRLEQDPIYHTRTCGLFVPSLRTEDPFSDAWYGVDQTRSGLSKEEDLSGPFLLLLWV